MFPTGLLDDLWRFKPRPPSADCLLLYLTMAEFLFGMVLLTPMFVLELGLCCIR